MLEVMQFNHDAMEKAGTDAWNAHIKRVEKTEQALTKLWQWAEDLQEDRDVLLLPLLQRLATAEEQLEAKVNQHTAILSATDVAQHKMRSSEATAAVAAGVVSIPTAAAGADEVCEGLPPIAHARLPERTPLREEARGHKDRSPVWTPAQTPAQRQLGSTASDMMRATTQSDD